MAGNYFWASVPTTVTGSVSGVSGTTSLNTHLTEFLIDESSESFFGQFNNEKYERAGGVVGYTKTASITSMDMNTTETAGLRVGDLWTTCVVVYEAEGADKDAAGTGDMTVTIREMLIESSSKTDAGGRLAVNATARLISDDGSTDPVSYSIADA